MSLPTDVTTICQELIRLNTSNYGEDTGLHSGALGPGERQAAEYVAAHLDMLGLQPTLVETKPGRASVIARWTPNQPSQPEPLLIHGHLDVVPAQADDWTLPPFQAQLHEDCVWGRGAVDMKGFDAQLLAWLHLLRAQGREPNRELVVAFLADEEAGGKYGADALVRTHPELFAGCTHAISEVGGFSTTVAGKRFYLLESAQKGVAWMRLVAEGSAGHGSMVASDNAVTTLCQAVTRLGEHQWPVQITPSVRAFLDTVSEALGMQIDHSDPRAVVAQLGSMARMVGATLSHTTNPTMLEAGYKVNVIPGQASASIDGRHLPGLGEQFYQQVDQLIGPQVRRETIWQTEGLEAPAQGPFWQQMQAAILAEDPQAIVTAYCLSGGTDNASFARLGITGYGFAPLQLPAQLDFPSMFHGVDERVPVQALEFGVRVLDRLLGGETVQHPAQQTTQES